MPKPRAMSNSAGPNADEPRDAPSPGADPLSPPRALLLPRAGFRLGGGLPPACVIRRNFSFGLNIPGVRRKFVENPPDFPGCGGNQPAPNQNRMTTGLATFAARLRDRFASWAASPGEALPETGFNLLALELFAAQFAANESYRRLCHARRASPETVEHWTRIPAVPAAAFKEVEMTCLPPAARERVFHTSGATAQTPGRHFHSAESLALYEASLWPWFARHVLDDGGAIRRDWLVLTPPPALAPGSSLVHMLESARRRANVARTTCAGALDGGGAWVVDVRRAVEALAEARQSGRPVCALGTAFNFIHLLDERAGGAPAPGFHLPPGSVVMETGGYKGRSRELPKAGLRALIASALGVPPSRIVCEYGMCELGSQAYDRVAGAPDGGGKPETRNFHFPPWCRARIISPENGREVSDGEAGLVRVFDLANVFSVAAIQTEDLAVRRGAGFELLGRASRAEARGCSWMAP